MKMIKFILSLMLVFGILMIAVTFYLSPDDLINCPGMPTTDSCQKVDAIVAISGGTTSARTEEAVSLYKDGWADKIIFSGAAADKTGPSNAKTMQAEAVALGVPSSDIMLDEESNDTSENADFTKEIITKNNIKSLILTTSGYHQRRAYLEFERALKDDSVRIVNHPASADPDWDGLWWTKKRGWSLVANEAAGIALFYAHQGAGSV